jgi:hypothetical protein
MFELSQQQVRSANSSPLEVDHIHSFATCVYQVLNKLQIPDSEMKQLGDFLESELDPELELIHHQEKVCLTDYRAWKSDPKNMDKRTLFAASFCQLLEMRPQLQRMNSKFADLQDDFGY